MKALTGTKIGVVTAIKHLGTSGILMDDSS